MIFERSLYEVPVTKAYQYCQKRKINLKMVTDGKKFYLCRSGWVRKMPTGSTSA